MPVPLETVLIFIPAAFFLTLSPGPNNLLAMSHGARFGISMAITAGFGRLAAFVIMIAVTAVGLGAALAASEMAFHVIKWVGAVYLIWLGFRTWRARVDAGENDDREENALSGDGERQTGKGLRARLWNEFAVAMGNPKAILIFTAFFPQFLDTSAPFVPQFAELGAVFLVLEMAALSIYAVSGRFISAKLKGVKGRLIMNRASGGALMLAGAALAASQR